MKNILSILSRFFLTVGFILAMAVLYCNIRVKIYAEPRLYDSVKDIPHRRTALLLGTSPKTQSGNINKYFEYRIDAAVALYTAKKVDYIIVSGDNKHKNYNEPEAMRRALVIRGVPNDVIYLDYAGFRSLDSIVRAKEIFGQTSVIVVSQKFHNERAIFIAKRKGLDAIGYNARDAQIKYGLRTRVREVFARCKMFVDLLIDKQPYFLGEQIGVG